MSTTKLFEHSKRRKLPDGRCHRVLYDEHPLGHGDGSAKGGKPLKHSSLSMALLGDPCLGFVGALGVHEGAPYSAVWCRQGRLRLELCGELVEELAVAWVADVPAVPVVDGWSGQQSLL